MAQPPAEALKERGVKRQKDSQTGKLWYIEPPIAWNRWRVMNQPIKSLKEAAPVEPSQTTKPRSRRRVAMISVLVLLVLGGVVWWSRERSAPQQAAGGRNAPPMSIVPETVGKGDIGINLNGLGTVTSLATVTVRTQISGYLLKG